VEGEARANNTKMGGPRPTCGLVTLLRKGPPQQLFCDLSCAAVCDTHGSLYARKKKSVATKNFSLCRRPLRSEAPSSGPSPSSLRRALGTTTAIPRASALGTVPTGRVQLVYRFFNAAHADNLDQGTRFNGGGTANDDYDFGEGNDICNYVRDHDYDDDDRDTCRGSEAEGSGKIPEVEEGAAGGNFSKEGPRTIIVVELCSGALPRQPHVYRSANPGRPIRVHYLSYVFMR